MNNYTEMNNYHIGDALEIYLSEYLAREGFWVHRLYRGHHGEQPADIIAVLRGHPFLIDCKAVTSKRGFPLTRIEENQISAMEAWKRKGNGEGWFALQVENEVYMISMEGFKAYALETKRKTMPLTDIRERGMKVEEWIQDQYGNE